MAARKKKTTVRQRGEEETALTTTAMESIPSLSATWEKKLAGKVSKDKASADSMDAGLPFISTEGATFTFNDDDIGDEINVYVLGAVRENVLYREGYSRNKRTGASCYAIDSEFSGELAPKPEIAEKQKTGPTCELCPYNEFGSDFRGGAGKACKNYTRLLVLPENEDDPGTLQKAQAARMRIPPTSGKFWSKYSKKITDGLHRPLFAVKTALVISPDAKSQFIVEPEFIAPVLDEKLLQVLWDRAEEHESDLIFPPTLALEDPSKGRESSKRTRKTKVVKKKKVVRRKTSR